MTRTSKESIDRLKKAILLSVIADFNLNLRRLKRAKKSLGINRSLGEIADLFVFLDSEWYKLLTNSNSPSDDIKNRLMSNMPDEHKDALLNIINNKKAQYKKVGLKF